MSTSENAELMDVIARTWDQMGNRGSNAEVAEHVLSIIVSVEALMLLPALTVYLVRKALTSKVGEFFRQRTAEGLAIAPAIDEHGTHADLALLDEHEFRYVIAKHVRRGKGAFKIAKKYAALAEERLGVEISLSDPMAGAA